jgi:phosphoserine phosphatase
LLNLILRSPTLARANVDELALVTQASAIEEISPHAFRLRHASKNNAVIAFCEAQGIDYGWVPERRRFAELRLLAMHLDSTLITIECIDELGDLAGKKASATRKVRSAAPPGDA